jgi:hypothetical protein
MNIGEMKQIEVRPKEHVCGVEWGHAIPHGHPPPPPRARDVRLILATPSLFLSPVKKKKEITEIRIQLVLRIKALFFCRKTARGLEFSLNNSGNGSQTDVVSYRMYRMKEKDFASNVITQ